MLPSEVVRFWREAGSGKWFGKDPAFDAEFRERFLTAHELAASDGLDMWAVTAEGALALLILLDQFPRNAFRDTARMFATDAKARDVASAAVERGQDGQVEEALRSFVYLPFEHSEQLADQDRSVALFQPLGEELLKWAVMHRDIIVKFGRFPHRNEILGRESTPEEIAFLKSGGFAG
ncbi:DUF924 family protein [Sandaracinobacteroides hominis]|uniref:DUF924 family protein n=1 Tax=Sandaracinobacteroides hominis TaxID=2780086 RepID=UPI0018F46929|nr:DUF924 family protein [Sandaracinobacteroides hominis]